MWICVLECDHFTAVEHLCFLQFTFFLFLPFNGMSPTRCLEVGGAGQKPHILY